MPKSTPAEAALARGRPRSAPTQFPQAAAPSRTAEGRASDRSVAPSRPPAGSAARLRSSLPTRAILGPARKEDAGRNRTDTQGPRSGAWGPPHGCPQPALAPPGRGGGLNVLGAGYISRGLGAPGVRLPPKQVPYRSLESPGSNKPKNQRVQLLAVDHSARASMKNAASCEK